MKITMISTWIRGYSSRSSGRDHYQKTMNGISKLQFGPVVRSKAARARSKPSSGDEHWPREDESSQYFWDNYEKQSSEEKKSPLKISSPKKRESKSKKITAPPPVEPSLSVLRVPFEKRRAGSWVSVSTVLRETMSEENRAVLAAWEARKIAELGQDGFNRYKQDTFSRGKALHAWIEEYLEHREPPADPLRFTDPVTQRHIESLAPVLPRIGTVAALESAVYHPDLQYCGIMDCVAVLGKTLSLIDWKTSERAKPTVASLYDNPLQVVAYLDAMKADPTYSSLNISDSVAVVVIYNSGYSAVVHKLSRRRIQLLRQQWLQRLHQFRKLSGPL